MTFQETPHPFVKPVLLTTVEMKRETSYYRLEKFRSSPSMGAFGYEPCQFPRTKDGLVDAIGHAELLCGLLYAPTVAGEEE